MKYIIFSLILVLLPTQLLAESIRVGYFVVSPHVIEKKDGGITGASVEFFEQKIAPEMGVKVIWAKHATSIPRQLMELQRNELDVGLVFAKNLERSKILFYPDSYFFESNPAIALLKNHPLQKINKVEDILDLKIGYGKGAFLSPLMRDKRINFELISDPNWIDMNFKKVMIGRIDAFYQPERPTLLYLARQLDIEKKVKILNLPESTKLYNAFSKKANNNLVKRYDRAFKKLDGKKMYLEILSKYIDIGSL